MAFLDYDGLSLFKSNFETLVNGKLDEKTDMLFLSGSTWSNIWNVLNKIQPNKAYVFVSDTEATRLITENFQHDYYYGLIIKTGDNSFECFANRRNAENVQLFYFSCNSSGVQSSGQYNILTGANIKNTLTEESSGFALDARQGWTLNNAKLDKTSVYNGLDKTDTGYALDATQGKALNDGKLDKTSVYNGLDKTATGFALDASQGKSLNDNKLDKTSVYNGLDKTTSGFALDARQGKTLNDDKLDKTSVYNDLDKTTSGFALDARQGKSLSDTLATKAKWIALQTTDNTWAKIWAKLNTLETGDVATIYVANEALDVITGGERNTGTPSGVVFRTSSTGFHFLLKNTSNNIIACTLMSVSSSSAGTYSEYMYAYANILTMSHYTGTNAISDLHTISYGQWGRATFRAAVSPTGSDVTMNYVCSGSTANYKSIIAMANENFYMNTAYGSSGAWQGWKRFVSEDEVPKFSTISVANNDTFNIANNSRIKIDICSSTAARCGVATFYATASGTITHNKTGASSLTFDVATANTLKVTGASGTVNFFVTTYAGSFTKNST